MPLKQKQKNPVNIRHLQPPEDLAPAFVAGRGDERLEDVAASRVWSQSQEVSGRQSTQAAEEKRALLKLSQRLDQPGAVVTDGGQRYLGERKKKRRKDLTETAIFRAALGC